MAIQWTPWNVPMHRRLEVLSVAFYILCGVYSGPLTVLTLLYLLYAGNIYLKILAGSYLTFVYVDRHTGDNGGRGSGWAWWRSQSVWKHCVNYFPIDLVKTVDLPPNQNYLLCVFPHGLFVIGAAGNLGTSHSKWSSLFPGLRPKITTLKCNLIMPGCREALLFQGLSAATEKALKTLLLQSNDPTDRSNRDGYAGNAVALIAGGAREAMAFVPNTYKCAISKRRGFVRIAMQTGSSLVPVISFGENNVYREIDLSGPFGRFIKYLFKRFLNTNLVIPTGRGIFQYNYGFIPIRHPVTTVVGAPIHLPKTPNPSTEEIERYYDLFCSQLKELFETHKSKYVKDSEKIYLEII